MSRVSIHSQILEVERELALRRGAYPRQVGAGKMRPAEAELLIGRMEAVSATLCWVRDNEAAIRAWVAEKKAST